MRRLGLSLVLLFSAVLWLLGTETGSRWLLQRAIPRVPGELHIESIHGTLLGTIELQGVRYRGEGLAVGFDRGGLRWQPLQLMRGILFIRTLTLKGLEVQKQRGKEKGRFSPPELRLPIAIAVERAVVEEARLFLPQGTFQVRRLDLSARWDRQGIEVRSLSLEGERPRLSLSMAGRILPEGGYPFALDVRFRLPWKGALWKGGGSVAGDLRRIRLSQRLEAPFEVSLEGEVTKGGDVEEKRVKRREERDRGGGYGRFLVPLHSLLDDWRLTLSGEARGAGMEVAFELEGKGDRQGMALSKVKVKVLGGTLEGRGKLAWMPRPSWHIALQGRGLNPGKRWPPLQGKLSLSALIDGSWQEGLLATAKALEIEGTLAGHPLSLAGSLEVKGKTWHIHHLEIQGEDARLKASGTLGERWDMQASLEARLPGASRIEAQGKVRGVRDRPDIALDLDIELPRATGKVKAAGPLTAGTWRATLFEAAFSSPSLGAWRLGATVPLRAGRGGVTLKEACWFQGRGRLCLGGFWGGGRFQVEGRIRDVPLRLFRAWIPPGTALEGQLDGDFLWRPEGGEARLFSPQGKVIVRPIEGEALTLVYQKALLQGSLEGEELALTADAALGDGGFIRGEMRLHPFKIQAWRKAPLKGKVEARLSTLGFASALLPVVEGGKGMLEGSLDVSGTLEAPSVKGTMAFRQEEVEVVPLGITLKTLKLRIEGGGRGPLRLEGSVRSGPGTLSVSGDLALDGRGTLKVKGERFEAVDLPEAHAYVSPDLTVILQRPEIEITGRLLVPEARLTLKRLPEGAVGVSEDVVILGRQKQPPAWKVTSRIEVVLGDEVRFSGFGLRARLAGKVRIIDEPGGPPLGEGEIELIEGVYEAYGQKLDIEKGRFFFSGPLDHPVIDLRAVRKVDDVTAGILATGTPKSLQVSVFSEPPMPQDEALAYLILGHPLGESTGGEGQLLMQAIYSLGLKGGENLAGIIGKRLGIEEVKVKKGSTLGETALVLGKYLSPRLYVSYGIGLFEPSSTLRIRYKVSSRLTLQVESGAKSAVDLLYSVEW